jgi:hypothetical protein
MPGARIICIDRTNDGRGPFAQVYLELLRLWLANTSESRRWIFKTISSCGLFISSDFSHKHSKLFPHSGHGLFKSKQERENLALSAFHKQGSFEGSEKRVVLARVGNRKIRGVRASDFANDYVICFDGQSYELLKNLRQAAENDAHGSHQRAEIHLVDIAHDLHKHDREMQAAKQMLRKWAMKNLGWLEPVRPMEMGFWGTRQVQIPEAGFVALLRDKERRLVDIKKVTGCDFHFSSESEEGLRIVSIVGNKDRLDLAATKVLYTW